ncbi:MAG: peptide deformylase [Sulfurimonas sp.]|nr:peptide deformylase [Sulfurimonas sp.]
MIQQIIKYPTPPSVQYSTDVRVFNENIFSLIDDLKDTINANDLDGLAAFQIGSYYNIVLIKNQDGTFLELLNPRLISTNGKITTKETTAYFPNLSADVQRHDKISIVYQDRDGAQHSLQAEGALSVLIQRKIDYTFGSSFLHKLSKEEKKIFEKKLEFGSDVAISEVCPTTFKRDYLTKLSNILTIIIAAAFVVGLFMSDELRLSLWHAQLYLSYGVLVTNVVYFFYAQYEGRGYTSCTSCQIGNILGTTVISLTKLTLIMILSYFLVNPF